MENENIVYWSPSSAGFYESDFHGVKGEDGSSVPSDATEISHQQRDDLIRGQSDGKIIVSDELGIPSLSDPARPGRAEIESFVVNYRDIAWSSEIVSSTNGVRAKTDALTRQRVNEKLKYLESKGEGTVIRWKGPDGFVDATADDFRDITLAAEDVRQRAFDAEDAITGREFRTIEEAKKAFDEAYKGQ